MDPEPAEDEAEAAVCTPDAPGNNAAVCCMRRGETPKVVGQLPGQVGWSSRSGMCVVFDVCVSVCVSVSVCMLVAVC